MPESRHDKHPQPKQKNRKPEVETRLLKRPQHQVVRKVFYLPIIKVNQNGKADVVRKTYFYQQQSSDSQKHRIPKAVSSPIFYIKYLVMLVSDKNPEAKNTFRLFLNSLKSFMAKQSFFKLSKAFKQVKTL